jgi:hypothetical protein
VKAYLAPSKDGILAIRAETADLAMKLSTEAEGGGIHELPPAVAAALDIPEREGTYRMARPNWINAFVCFPGAPHPAA